MKTTIQAPLVIISFAFLSCEKTDVTSTTDLSASQLKSAILAATDEIELKGKMPMAKTEGQHKGSAKQDGQ
jgi:hypothetical protein